MDILTRQLPSYCTPGRAIAPAGIVVHYISGRFTTRSDDRYDVDVVHQLLCDLNKPGIQRSNLMLPSDRNGGRAYASYHYFIARDGLIWQFADDSQEVYHAGRSIMHGRESCNRFTLGVALAGQEGQPFEEAQYEALAELAAQKTAQYGFDASWIQGHDKVRADWLAKYPGTDVRKPDPGPLFDWERFFEILAAKEATA